MSLSVFYLADLSNQLEAGNGADVYLQDQTFHHAIRVQRHRVGEMLELTDGQGLRVRISITAVESDGARARVERVVHEETPEPRLHLVQALAKGGRDEQAIETATELGVHEVTPWKADRSIADWPVAKRPKAQQKWENTVLSAMQQSRRAYLPRIHSLQTSDLLAKRIAEREANAAVLVLHESTRTKLTDVSLSEYADITFVVGPEGGMSERELTMFTEAGALTVRLGTHVLRSSTAGSAGLAVVQTMLGQW